ncbi:Long chain acyl-CoA synthetase 7, peroxisomal [Zancudomyces culisetae]|uniref:Long chain acyl-CoA synthetase 7, peroxisomal n=1 Tax=Zancudomyces culisetae TaxID=1213189 RepID=A0A1R1PE27_ZANCU|nr:Long chain acyl-CoA synthetase 7, peroxisomal [Zancudomyces culisetae]OMH79797.1 Long chain acyl-CoA synthetase 7, peroxisomal [Zancudomyces culisetae]|eukprot:OMH79216.1 Long chain acyl-CoA synthetase 7, peroxisomal [Zancudomyces culisetae]
MATKDQLVSYAVPNSAEPGLSSVKTYQDRNLFGYRPYDREEKKYLPFEFKTYKQVGEEVNLLSSGLIHAIKKHTRSDDIEGLKLIEKRNFGVALYSRNRPEWAIAERAAFTQSLYSVALYDTLGVSSTQFILNHSEAVILVCSLEKIPKILESIDTVPKLKVIISMDNFDSINSNITAGDVWKVPSITTRSISVLKKWAASNNVGLYDFNDVMEFGRQHPIPHFPPKLDDIYTLCYTSGTTGNPKGAVSSHRNYGFACLASSANMMENQSLIPVLLSYLPLAHCYGRNVENAILFSGGEIGYFCGDIAAIMDDCRMLQPTHFPGVPRLLNRIYDFITSKTIHAPGLVGKVSRQAVEEKIQNLQEGKGVEHEFWDTVLFNKTKAVVSSRLTTMGSGSAPLEPHVNNFLRIALIVNLTQGYGLTETAAYCIGQTQGTITADDIGAPKPGCEARLRDVPEMEYFVTDKPCPRGELLIRGKNVFVGYFKDEEKTKEALIGDGWFATGDIASFNEDGSVSIIDRKKNIFKLSQGEYVAPEKIENILSKHRLVAQSFVHGYSTKNCVVGVLVPDEEAFVPWARSVLSEKDSGYTKEDVAKMDFKELVQNSAVNKRFLATMENHAKQSKLQGFEVLKAIYLEHVLFDMDTNQLLTPTMKLKRFDAAKYYKSIIDELYQSVAA